MPKSMTDPILSILQEYERDPARNDKKAVLLTPQAKGNYYVEFHSRWGRKPASRSFVTPRWKRCTDCYEKQEAHDSPKSCRTRNCGNAPKPCGGTICMG